MTRSGARPRLLWKLEDVGNESGEPSPEDVGPAWLDFPDGRASEKVRGGVWITRREAAEIARENGYVLHEDDGRSTEDVSDQPSPTALDAKAINSRLRSLGTSPEELTVDVSGDRVGLIGSMVDQLTRPSRRGSAEAAKFGFRTQAVSLPPEEALAALDELVPGWR